jgi:hypothetical protein
MRPVVVFAYGEPERRRLTMNNLFKARNPVRDSSGERTAAVIAALSIIVMAIAAIGAYAVIHGRLVVQGDGLATAANLRAQPGLFTAEVALWVLIALTDLAVSLALWRWLARLGGSLPWVTAGARILYTLSLGAGIVFLALAARSTDPLKEIGVFERIWSLGLIVFGAHLTLLASACFRSGFVPGIWSWLLVVAGPSYAVINVLKNLGPGLARASAALETVLSVPMTAAELGLAAWLLVRSARSARSSKPALDPAE